jgi:hypothetical protein
MASVGHVDKGRIGEESEEKSWRADSMIELRILCHLLARLRDVVELLALPAADDAALIALAAEQLLVLHTS